MKQKVIDGKRYYVNPDGVLVHESQVPAAKIRTDELVNKVVANAIMLQRALRETKGNNAAMIRELYELHGLNPDEPVCLTFKNYDGSAKVAVKVGKRLDYGPEMVKARALIDECLMSWSEGSRAELIQLINAAFRTNSAGSLPRSQVLGLLKLDIDEPLWNEAMGLIKASLHVDFSKTYHTFSFRDEESGEFVTTDLQYAKARPAHTPPAEPKAKPVTATKPRKRKTA